MARSSQNGVFSQRIAPFIPLALAFLASRILAPVTSTQVGTTVTGAPPPAAAGPAVATCDADVDSVETCHSKYPTGCSHSSAPGYDAYLNFLKNQVPAPSSPALFKLDQRAFSDLNAKTPAALTDRTHAQYEKQLAQLNEGKVGAVTGHLYYARFGGRSETVNCQLTDPEEIDYHIGIGFDASLGAKIANKEKLSTDEDASLETSSVVIEMTPHYRGRFEPDWTLDALKAVLGKQVRVTGQLLIDNEHLGGKENCGAPNAEPSTCWRFSAWELHPVTRFEVCQATDQRCAADSSDWIALEDIGKTAHAATTPLAAGPSQ